LKQLRNGQDEELVNTISSYQENESMQPNQDLPLLPDLEPFRLGQPLDVGNRVDYIGGLDVSNSEGEPGPEYAFFTSEEEESDSNNSDVDI
jgi:hypothetical protein